MEFKIVAPKKKGIRDGFLRKATIIAETPEEQKALFDAVEKLSGDGWPMKARFAPEVRP